MCRVRRFLEQMCLSPQVEDRERLCCNDWSRRVILLFGSNEVEELRVRGVMTGTMETVQYFLEGIATLLVNLDLDQQTDLYTGVVDENT